MHTSIQNSVKEYLANEIRHLRDSEVYYKRLELQEAIEKAAFGQSPKVNGRVNMDSHQRRVGYKACQAGYKELVKLNQITPLSECRDFEELFAITEKIKGKISRLGNLWSYDTALRIGFKLGKYPREVYVQAGVVKGVKKALNGKVPKGRCIPLSSFPVEIQKLKAYEVENFLCIWGKNKRDSLC